MATREIRTADDPLLKAGKDTFLDSYLHEMVCEALVWRWEAVEISTSISVATTATGSTITGWALWNLPGWKALWAVAAGVASLAAIAHGAMTVPARVKNQEELRRSFSELRVNLETFLHQLAISPPEPEQEETFLELRERYARTRSQAKPDIAYTKALYRKAQERLSVELRGRFRPWVIRSRSVFRTTRLTPAACRTELA